MLFLELIFWALALLVVYVYAGYPLLLAIWAAVASRPVQRGGGLPPVTLVISAFNERDVIAAKIENSIALDYPRESLDVLVVSDASDDGTDDIVLRYADSGVRLLRMQDRGGKTVGLNAAVDAANGDIVVFSDANAMYEADAIRALVANFEDPSVGAAVGESTYRDSESDADRSESAYWRYETAIKRLESRLGSVVGGDGAIYAVRKSLYRPMAADALSDFVNPLQVVEQGMRCVYVPEAVSVEEAAGSFDKEFRRKVRIVNRAWRATWSMKQMLNPFRFGRFAWQMVSHKLLRWLVPVFLLLIFVLNVALLRQGPVYQLLFVAQLAFYGLAGLGALTGGSSRSAAIYGPYYFCLVNLASLLGIRDAYRGMTYTTWSTARADDQ